MRRSSRGVGEADKVGKAMQLGHSRGEPGRKGDTSRGRGKAIKVVQQGVGKARLEGGGTQWRKRQGQAGRQGDAVDGPGEAYEAVQSWQAGWC